MACSASPPLYYAEMVGHCLSGLPDEACGLFGGDPASGDVVAATRPGTWPPRPSSTPSTPASISGPTATPRPTGIEIIGVFHSHTHTDAYPSPTDVAQAPDPDWHYVLVSLRDTHPRGAVLPDRTGTGWTRSR
jgi:proteasome lid subunit RPN8/RPN11